RRFQDQALLLDRILDRLKAGQENLDIIRWALDWNISLLSVRDILEALDINSRRLAHRFDPVAQPFREEKNKGIRTRFRSTVLEPNPKASSPYRNDAGYDPLH